MSTQPKSHLPAERPKGVMVKVSGDADAVEAVLLKMLAVKLTGLDQFAAALEIHMPWPNSGEVPIPVHVALIKSENGGLRTTPGAKSSLRLVTPRTRRKSDIGKLMCLQNPLICMSCPHHY